LTGGAQCEVRGYSPLEVLKAVQERLMLLLGCLSPKGAACLTASRPSLRNIMV